MTPNSPGGADAVLPATVHASTSPRVAGGHPAGGAGLSNSESRPGSGEPEVPTTGEPRPVRIQRSTVRVWLCLVLMALGTVPCILAIGVPGR